MFRDLYKKGLLCIVCLLLSYIGLFFGTIFISYSTDLSVLESLAILTLYIIVISYCTISYYRRSTFTWIRLGYYAWQIYKVEKKFTLAASTSKNHASDLTRLKNIRDDYFKLEKKADVLINLVLKENENVKR